MPRRQRPQSPISFNPMSAMKSIAARSNPILALNSAYTAGKSAYNDPRMQDAHWAMKGMLGVHAGILDYGNPIPGMDIDPIAAIGQTNHREVHDMMSLEDYGGGLRR